MVREARLFNENWRLETAIVTEPGADWIRIEDQVTNDSARTQDLQMLYHVNYGPPLLEPGAKVLAPTDWVMPRDEVARENEVVTTRCWRSVGLSASS